ncbi:MAG: hypothetical protein ABSE16_14675 [Verrucomicrobiota bacterium]|jgi:hypothetical protein
MQPIFADALTWTQIGVFAAIASAAVGVAAFFSRSRVSVSPQPLRIEITKELADKFADKKVFEAHVAENKEHHAKFENRFREVDINMPKVMQSISAEWRGWADAKLSDLALAHKAASADQWKEINEIKKSFESVARALGRIEGRLERNDQ